MDLRDLRDALDDLPDGLYGTYSRILARVDARNQEKAIAMLQLLVWAQRELRLGELVDALAIRQGEKGLHYDPGSKMPVPNEVLKILPGLIIFDTVKHPASKDFFRFLFARPSVRVVRLAHLSVKEYLTSGCVHETFKPRLEKLTAHIAIFSMCIAHFYNRYPEPHIFLSDLKDSHEKDGETRDLPYFVYYLYYWEDHARIAQADESAAKSMVKLLTSGRASDSPLARCFLLMYPDPSKTYEKVEGTALYYASACGLDRVVSRLLEHDAQAIENSYIDGRFSALEEATQRCYEETVRILLVNGATPTMETVPLLFGDRSNETVIALRILRMLLDHGAKPTFTALQFAVWQWNIQLIQFLLDNGAPMIDDNRSHPFGMLYTRPLLHQACQNKPNGLAIAKMLLDYGAEIDALDGEHRTALDVVDDHAIERLLLERGADVTASKYPLHGTVKYNRQEEMVLLLESGVNIDAQDQSGRTALHMAVESHPRSLDFTELLLDRGANVLIKDCSGLSALDNVLRDLWYYEYFMQKESWLHMCCALLKAMWNQLRSAKAVSKKRRKRPRPLRYNRELTSRRRRLYGLDFKD